MTTSVLLLAIGFFVLLKGADYLVNGASALARHFSVSPLVIGLTVVAFGTSAPELLVNIFASAGGQSGIAIGNVIGSNIANVLLVLGVAALVRPLVVQHSTVWKEIPFSVLAVFVLAALANDILIDGAPASVLSRIDGFILIAFFGIFLNYCFGGTDADLGTTTTNTAPPPFTTTAIFQTLLGLIGLGLGGKLVVDAATALAFSLGVSEALIGLTIVALGTSLPELFTSAVAAYKGQTDLAVGNAVGSNIFNVFWVLGVSAIIRPLPLPSDQNTDIIMAILASVLLFIFVLIGKKFALQRWQGGLLVVLYIGYILLLTQRG